MHLCQQTENEGGVEYPVTGTRQGTGRIQAPDCRHPCLGVLGRFTHEYLKGIAHQLFFLGHPPASLIVLKYRFARGNSPSVSI